jgi:glycerophosphoryl diester phosphodiesterase
VISFLLAIALLPEADAFDLQAHRGGRGLRPENTLPAFENALAIGVSTLETDLAMTRDGLLVLSHDARLNPALTRGPDGRWLVVGPAIFSLGRDELAVFDVGRLDPESSYGRQWPDQRAVDGTRVPSLAALFALGRDRPVRFNIETKLTPDSSDEVPDADQFARAVVEEIRRAGMAHRVTVQSFDWRSLLAVKRIAPDIETACLTIETNNNNTVRPEADGGSRWHAGLKLTEHGSLPRLVRAAGCSIWSPFWRNVSASAVVEARALRLKVLPWTVNEPADMEHVIDLQVDGLITDYPDRARRVLAARGIAID